MAHHVGEHAAPLLLALPEPGHVRAGMLLGRAREIGPAGERYGAPPDDLLPALNRRREHLVLQIAGGEPGVGGERDHGAGLCEVARKRLLAGNAAQPLAALHRLVDRLHGGNPDVVGREDPERIHVLRLDQLVERGMGGAGAEVELVGALGQPGAALFRRAVDPGDRAIAHAGEGFEVEAGDEARADHPDTQRLQRLALGPWSLPPPAADARPALWHLVTTRHSTRDPQLASMAARGVLI